MNTMTKHQDSLYIDQWPELESTVREFLQLLDINSSVSFGDGEIEAIECRSRDGFYRASHNYGGFDLYHHSDVGACEGGGSGPNLAAIERHVEAAYKSAKAQFISDNTDKLTALDIDESNCDYHTLYKLGQGQLAEELSDMERSWMGTSVWWGIRAMYEGQDNGIHTLCLYASGNVCEYYGAFGKGSQTLAEFELKFKTVSGLKRQLQRLKHKLEAAF